MLGSFVHIPLYLSVKSAITRACSFSLLSTRHYLAPPISIISSTNNRGCILPNYWLLVSALHIKVGITEESDDVSRLLSMIFHMFNLPRLRYYEMVGSIKLMYDVLYMHVCTFILLCQFCDHFS